MTGSIAGRIHGYIDNDSAVGLMSKYYSGRYTGALFDTAPQLRGNDDNRITTADMVAMATLSVPLAGAVVQQLFEREDDIAAKLAAVPTGVVLSEASDDDLALLYGVQDLLDEVHGLGHVTRSKLLARKRPDLVPIRDQHVLTALVGRNHGAFTEPLREALAGDPTIERRLREIVGLAKIGGAISAIRALDVVVWMAVHGDAQVDN